MRFQTHSAKFHIRFDHMWAANSFPLSLSLWFFPQPGKLLHSARPLTSSNFERGNIQEQVSGTRVEHEWNTGGTRVILLFGTWKHAQIFLHCRPNVAKESGKVRSPFKAFWVIVSWVLLSLSSKLCVWPFSRFVILHPCVLFDCARKLMICNHTKWMAILSTLLL